MCSMLHACVQRWSSFLADSKLTSWLSLAQSFHYLLPGYVRMHGVTLHAYLLMFVLFSALKLYLLVCHQGPRGVGV